MSTAFETQIKKPEKHEVREQTSPTEQTKATSTKVGMVQGAEFQTKRADVVTSSALPSHLETNPERAREKPRRASHVTATEMFLSNFYFWLFTFYSFLFESYGSRNILQFSTIFVSDIFDFSPTFTG